MTDLEHFRSTCIHLLTILDAETNRLMQLVSARTTSGYAWDEAVMRQREAYCAWIDYLNEPVTGAHAYAGNTLPTPATPSHGERHLYLVCDNTQR